MRINLLTRTIAAALATLALAGCGRDADPAGGYVTGTEQSSIDATTEPAIAEPVREPELDPVAELEYADVTRVREVNDSTPVYGTVIASQAVTQDVAQPQQVCRDVVIEERQPERDGLKGGTIAGAIIGGVVGNQVGGDGDRQKLATVAGAVAGGYAGRAIDRRHEGGDIVTRTEQQCETQSVSTTQVLGFDVTYREPDGDTATRRMETDQAIGSRISLGSRSRLVGYDVTYRYRGETQTIRMDTRPGDRLPVVDGEVVTSTVALNR
jgi:uncharacterized protein YcfJ